MLFILRKEEIFVWANIYSGIMNIENTINPRAVAQGLLVYLEYIYVKTGDAIQRCGQIAFSVI